MTRCDDLQNLLWRLARGFSAQDRNRPSERLQHLGVMQLRGGGDDHAIPTLTVAGHQPLGNHACPRKPALTELLSRWRALIAQTNQLRSPILHQSLGVDSPDLTAANQAELQSCHRMCHALRQ